jgi:L-amino acid N-acyltransferase YncA
MYFGDEWDMLDNKKKESVLKSNRREFGTNCESRYSFVSLLDEKIVGFIFAHEDLPFKDSILIRHIAVHPEYQRIGIGESLFNAVISQAKKEEKKSIKSSINPDNQSSIILHEKMGFEVSDWKQAKYKVKL